MGYTVVPGMSRKQIRAIAYMIQKTINLENPYYFPVVEFLEVVMPEIDSGFCLEYTTKKELPPNTYAYYDPVNNTMKIDEEVYIRACKGDGRDRFTIAHELGHYWLHRQCAFLPRREIENKPEAFMDPEWQANTFASELLMPYHLIKGMDATQIMKKCGTSYRAAEIASNVAKKPS